MQLHYFVKIKILKIVYVPHRWTAMPIYMDLTPFLVLNPAKIMENHAMIMLTTYPMDNRMVSWTSQGQHREPLFSVDKST